LPKDNFMTPSKIISTRRTLILFVFAWAYTDLGTVAHKNEMFSFFDVNYT